MSIRELKAQAREKLLHRYGSAAAAMLLHAAIVFAALLTGCFFLLIGMINTGWGYDTISFFLPSFKTSAPSAVIFVFLTIIVLVFAVFLDFQMSCGFTKMILKICRGEENGSGDIFYMFHRKSCPWKALWVGILRYIIVAVPALIPMFINGCAIVCGYEAQTAAWNDPWRIVIRSVQILTVIWMIYIGLRVYFAEFIVIDRPETGVADSLRESMRLTKGRVFRLIVLMLSYFFWAVLAGIVPVAYFFIAPYMETGIALYYIEGLEKPECPKTRELTEAAEQPRAAEPEAAEQPQAAGPEAAEQPQAAGPAAMPRKPKFPDIEAEAAPEMIKEEEITAETETHAPAEPAKEE